MDLFRYCNRDLFLKIVFPFFALALLVLNYSGPFQAYALEIGGADPVIRKVQMPSAIENTMIGQATMMQEMMEIDIEILKLLKEMARDEEIRVRIDKLITHYEEMLKKHQIIIEKMMR